LIKRIMAIVALLALVLFMAGSFGLAVAVPAAIVVVVACRGSTANKRIAATINYRILWSITFINRPISALVAFYGNSRRMVAGLFAPPEPALSPRFHLI
jgi:hypothetical protein